MKQLIQIIILSLQTKYQYTHHLKMIKKKTFILFTFFLIISLSSSQSCTTKFDLDNIIQDQIVIYPTNQNQFINESQQYFYPRTFFTTTPKILTSIQSYQLSQFPTIDYSLISKVSRSFVDFTFTANNMNWTFIKVKLWLTARSDLLIGSFVLQNIGPSSNLTFDIAIPSSFSTFIDQKTLQLNFITGLKATTSDQFYELDVKNTGISTDNSTFKVTVSALGQTSISKIQISYSIFNFQLSYFASGGGQISYTPISHSEYKKIHGSFAPIIYDIQGFDKIKISKTVGINLEFNVDPDYVLQTYAGNSFQELGVVYLTIGKQPSTVCSCDQFIMKSGCVDSCPALTYPFVNYAKGGKSCLTCSSKLNETINEFNTGCNCMDGLKRVGEYCVADIKLTECLAKNTVLSNGACICISGTHLVNGSCEQICKDNEVYNNSNSKCECAFGYFNIGGICGVCSSDKIYSENFKACICPDFQYIGSNGTCICIPTYFNYSGKCVNSCPSGFVKSGGTCVQSQNCSLNEIFQNGKCVCEGGTYMINKSCSVCPTTTYYNSSSLTCINCLANCAVCFNYSSCAQCKSQYYYNQTSNQCLLNKTCTVNQTLSNGNCQCINGTYEVNGSCTICPTGTFYNSEKKICQNCVGGCLSCKNSTSCDLCLPNYNFNLTLGYCAPTCGINQTLVNGGCECIGGTYRINGICTKCSSNQFYQLSSKSCKACILNCLTCSNASSCDKCVVTYFFNQTTKNCQPSNCPTNQTILNGKCDCIPGTYRVNGVCNVCKSDQFYNSVDQTCKICTQNCVNCANQVMCGQCALYFRLVNGECKFNLYDPKFGTPQFTEEIIITDFEFSEPSKARNLSDSDLTSIVKIEFEQVSYVPRQTIIRQNKENLSEIRVIFTYCGYIPLQQFNVTFTFNDPTVSIKQDIEVVSYDVLKKGLNNFFV